MGSFVATKRDVLCFALEKLGFKEKTNYKPYTSKYVVYYNDDSEFLFIDHHNHVRKGKNVDEASLVPPEVVNAWVEEARRRKGQHEA